jgi:Gpi18-like mannosyltransferase
MGADDDREWARALRIGLLTYVGSRLLVLLGVGLVAIARTQEDARNGLNRLPTSRHIREVLSAWDGYWYLDIVRDGYPRSVPPGVTYFMPEARAAFFPIFPTIVRVVDAVVPGGPATAAIAVNLVLGFGVISLIGVLARELWNVRVATTAMVLVAVFPGSFVLSMAYSESTMMLFATATLIALVRQRWWLAALLGVLTTATRPNGVAIVLAGCACVWIARRDRTVRWRALVATAVMPIGLIAVISYIGSAAGERWVWFRVQREAWDEGLSFGWSTLRFVAEWLVAPLGSPTRALTAASLIVIVIGLLALRRTRAHPALVAYTVGVVALMLSPATVTARPRFVITAFGLLLASAAWWEDHGPSDPARRRNVELVVIATSAAGLVTVTAIYGLLGAIP